MRVRVNLDETRWWGCDGRRAQAGCRKGLITACALHRGLRLRSTRYTGGFLEGRTTLVPGRHGTDQQTGPFMKLRQTHLIEWPPRRQDISPATLDRITQDPWLPSQKAQPRERRRPDPLEAVFEAEVVPLLKEAPDLRPAAIFEEMLLRHPELRPGIRRTLERCIRSWCARHGAEQDVIFGRFMTPRERDCGRTFCGPC
jgi:hypothetical protein